MVEIDPSQFIIPIIVGIVVPFVLVAMTKFGKTTEGTLTGTIEIKGLKTNMEEVKETMDKGFDKMEKALSVQSAEMRSEFTARDTEMRREFSKTNEKIETISSKLILHDYRLDLLDKERRSRTGNNPPIRDYEDDKE